MTTKTKTIRKRQSKKAEMPVPLEERTKGSKLRVGAHVSIAGGNIYPSPPTCTSVSQQIDHNG